MKRHRLRRYFITGLVVVAPVGLTIGVLIWSFRVLDGILGGAVRNTLGFRVPGLGFFLLAGLVLLIGWAVQQAAGRQLLHWWNQALSRFPLTGRIYNATSQIVQTMVGERKGIFQRVVLVPYPVEGIWAVGFVTSETPAVFTSVLGEPCHNVFVPTTPNPTSGFLLVVPASRVRPLDVSIDDAVKLVISAGAVNPREVDAPPGTRGLDLDFLLRDSSEHPRQ